MNVQKKVEFGGFIAFLASSKNCEKRQTTAYET